MSDAAEAARNAAWQEYQHRLANLTEREESMLRVAFMAGWRACALANETPAPPPAADAQP
jgi:hypothetical protein